MEGSSPARLYATLVGGVLVIAGIIGFFYNADFGVGDDLGADEVFGILAVNAWHNLVHIGLGALGLLLAATAAREYALWAGVIYLLIAFFGFTDILSGDTNDTILKIVPVNTEDNFLHLILGILGVGAAMATPKEGAPAVTPPPPAAPAA
jgi:hypothetical protein